MRGNREKSNKSYSQIINNSDCEIACVNPTRLIRHAANLSAPIVHGQGFSRHMIIADETVACLKTGLLMSFHER